MQQNQINSSPFINKTTILVKLLGFWGVELVESALKAKLFISRPRRRVHGHGL